MPRSASKGFRLITIIYWLLLLYIVAALVWWFITLEKQNQYLTSLRYAELETQKNSFSIHDWAAELSFHKDQPLYTQQGIR